MTEDQSTWANLPINPDDLILQRVVEGHQLEYKATWDQQIKPRVVRTVCAFANDLYHLNGGYIVLGIEEDSQGKPILPPRGLDDLNIDKAQREIIGACRGGVFPTYLPIVDVGPYQGKTIMILWVPAGDNRPYEAPCDDKGNRAYFVRSGSLTIEAQGDLLRQLIELAAKTPFDDRRSLTAKEDDLSPRLVRNFLADIQSSLALAEWSPRDLYLKLKLLVPLNAHFVPRNVALLFFSEDPEKFFSGARIEVVQFGDDAGGDLIEERYFGGPLPDQIRSCLRYLDGLAGRIDRKIEGQAEVERTVPYPYEAMEEAIVNALYHRGYESSEPVKVYLYPNRMEIISYPGPVPGVEIRHFMEGRVPQVPARNRRIGGLLKDLRLAEGRGTGIPKIKRKMQENGSPEALFDFNEERTYFATILPVHPRYQVLHALREAAQLWAIGQKPSAIDHLKRAWTDQRGSGALVSQLIEYIGALQGTSAAEEILHAFDKESLKSEAILPYITMARIMIDHKQPNQALAILKKAPPFQSIDDTVEAAILKRRAGDYQGAHHLFKEAFTRNPDDPKIVAEYAQAKKYLAKGLHSDRDIAAKKRLNRDAAELLRRAIQLTTDPTRAAWCWYHLADALTWLRAPVSEVEEAFLKAQSLLPNESIFTQRYTEWKRRRKPKGGGS